MVVTLVKKSDFNWDYVKINLRFISFDLIC